jgi:hypothetical protein
MKSKVLHAVAVAVALVSAVLPVALGLDPKLAAVAPTVVAVLAIAKSFLSAQGESVPEVK